MNKFRYQFASLHKAIRHGAHFVLLGDDKAPFEYKWRERKPWPKKVIEHARQQQSLGFVPASMGCLVVDVDEGGKQAVHEVKRTLLPAKCVSVVPSKSAGRFHIYYRIPSDCREIGNFQWQTANGRGEFRCHNGVIGLWNDVDNLIDSIINSTDRPVTPKQLAMISESLLDEITAKQYKTFSRKSKTPDEYEYVPQKGERNIKLNKWAFISGLKNESENDAKSRLWRLLAAAGMNTAEFNQTFKSGYEAGLRKSTPYK